MVYKKTMITPEQIRGARGMLGLTQAELARRARISTTGLNNIESGVSDPKLSTLLAIRAALEESGVQFIAENGGGPGVRLKGKGMASAPPAAEALGQAPREPTPDDDDEILPPAHARDDAPAGESAAAAPASGGVLGKVILSSASRPMASYKRSTPAPAWSSD